MSRSAVDAGRGRRGVGKGAAGGSGGATSGRRRRRRTAAGDNGAFRKIGGREGALRAGIVCAFPVGLESAFPVADDGRVEFGCRDDFLRLLMIEARRGDD